jgi:thymidylate synthase ThyX
MSISELTHAQVGGPSNGPFVLVLNNGALITSEDEAMLQALYSRSPASVLSHLDKLAEVGSGKFMASFYVGYGHKSIGDCGDTTIFIEGVSMLVAKAIQDWALYNGQEVSTRYVDFATQPFHSIGNEMVLFQEQFRQFYVDSLPLVKESLRKRYPKQDDEEEGKYDKAITARAFDILRGFLPAGALTSLAWHTNLRQAADKLNWLLSHPLAEVRDVAMRVKQALQQAHPNSFGHKQYEKSVVYRDVCMARDYYFSTKRLFSDVVLSRNSLSESLLDEYRNVLNSRPEKTELPKQIAEVGQLQFEFAIDFGSFRDVQRHRAVTQRMPLLGISQGFHAWYLNELPAEVFAHAVTLLNAVESWYSLQFETAEDLQYAVPMGYKVPCRMTGDLPALVYLVELRSSSTVHPTLRKVAQDMGKIIALLGIPVYLDESDSGRFDVKRGNQDIVAKIS